MYVVSLMTIVLEELCIDMCTQPIIRNIMQRKLSQLQIDEIITKYLTGKYTCEDLGREYDRTREAISVMMKKRGVIINTNLSQIMRTYTINEHYFSTIDTEDKAYFLGLLYADGCVHIKRNRIVLGLQEIDVHILDTMNSFMNSNRPIKTREISNQNPNWKNICVLTVASKIMANDLINLGCVPRKSLILEFPTEQQVPSHLIKHWLRGYFDGDGSIGFDHKRRWLRFSIVSTRNVCVGIQRLLTDALQINSYMRNKNNNIVTTDIRISGNKQIVKLMEWLYADATIFLKRKHDKFIYGQQHLYIR